MNDQRNDGGPWPAQSVNASPELFDHQAARFDERAGLPPEACRVIARRALELACVEPGALVVEIGPGTGQIGQWFGDAVRYLGVDLSAGMLKEFADRVGDQPGNRALIKADANSIWPVMSRAARLIFGSRALHLLNPEHVAAEAWRVASRTGATLLIGRIERPRDSVRSLMAREMNERLRRRGFEGRRGEQRDRRLSDACCRQGAQLLPITPVARWPVLSNPRQSIDSWRSIEKLGGIQVPVTIRDEVLAELEAWARDMFGGLDEPVASEETYVLKGLRLPPLPGT